MTRLRHGLLIGLTATIVLTATAASAQTSVAEQLIAPDSLADLDLVEDRAIDFAALAPDEESQPEYAAMEGWMRKWVEPGTTVGVVAMATALDAERGEAFLAGFQKSVPAEDRYSHPVHQDVVVLEATDPDDQPTLGAAFATEETVFVLVTAGPNRRDLLDRAIAAQLAVTGSGLQTQSAELAEEFEPADAAYRTGEFIGRLGFVIVLTGIAIWAWRRNRRLRTG